MFLHYFIPVALFAVMFIMFLVISKTMNNIINQLAKLEYILKKEQEFHVEVKEIKQLLNEEGDDED
ncbi:MAG: hypothetical protein GF398_05435 [Chitinivibrionales bacterium]|nr:hypothetical protein [Chitinivibrionales bacterium]